MQTKGLFAVGACRLYEFWAMGYGLSVIGYRLSVIGYRSSGVGYRMSVFGHRNSVIGHSPVSTSFRRAAKAPLNQSHNGSHGHRLSVFSNRLSIFALSSLLSHHPGCLLPSFRLLAMNSSSVIPKGESNAQFQQNMSHFRYRFSDDELFGW